MRVVGGEGRGRRLLSPDSRAIRPTADRIRESMFDLLGPGPSIGQVLDLFAGTGALGIEALSRGFSKAVFVDQDRSAVRLVFENLTRCRYQDRARVERQEALRFLQTPDALAPFSLVLIDPPYRQGLLEQALVCLGQTGWMIEGGRVMAESEANLVLPQQIGTLTLQKHRRYGDTSVWLFSKE